VPFRRRIVWSTASPLAFEFQCALTPSLCHSIPRQSAGFIVRKLCHLFAVGGMPQKFYNGD
jgi:hypothetical protein